LSLRLRERDRCSQKQPDRQDHPKLRLPEVKKDEARCFPVKENCPAGFLLPAGRCLFISH